MGFFCTLHILSFALRYRENSHGISKFKSSATYSMTFNLDNTHFLPHNKSWKFLWYFEIQTVCHFLYDFWVAQTNYILLGFKLDCLHFGEPMFVFILPSYSFSCKEIVEVFMEFQNSNNLQLGPLFLLSCIYQLLLYWFYVTVF